MRTKRRLYRYKKATRTTLKVNQSYKGETLESKLVRILNNKEPIKDGAPLIYTERKDGVKPEMDIRTDKWEIAAGAMDAVSRARLAKTMENPSTKTTDSAQSATIEQKGDGGTKSTEGTTADQPK